MTAKAKVNKTGAVECETDTIKKNKKKTRHAVK